MREFVGEREREREQEIWRASLNLISVMFEEVLLQEAYLTVITHPLSPQGVHCSRKMADAMESPSSRPVFGVFAPPPC